MSRFFRLTALTLGLAGLVASASQTARAEYFTYSTLVSAVNASSAGSPTPAPSTPAATSAVVTISSGTLTFAGLSDNAAIFAPAGFGGADIVYGTVDYTPTNNSSPAAYAVNVRFDVTFVNTANGLSQVVTFSGQESGFSGGAGRFINSSFTGFAGTPTNFVLGNDAFTVAGILPPKGPGSGVNTGLGSFSANVSIRAVPEPGSLALMGMGLVGAFGVFRRRRAQTA